jgi:7-dehydrocholesterol reductase
MARPIAPPAPVTIAFLPLSMAWTAYHGSKLPMTELEASALFAESEPKQRLRHTVIPLVLLTLCPPAVGVLWFTHTQLDGSVAMLARLVSERGLFTTVAQIWAPILFGTPTAWTMLAAFIALQMVLMRVVPGKPFEGPLTPKGNVPVYRANGVAAFVITLGSFIAASRAGVIRPTIIYDNFGPLLGALNVFSLGFCLLLYFKGRRAPSSSDSGTSGNRIFDYYWGTELHPSILGWNVKVLTNCRFAMMSWPLIILSFAAKQDALHGLSDSMIVAAGLQILYVAKFFWWEPGYLRSLDITHDRAGFYICWGCLVWVPSVYTASTLYLVDHPHRLGLPLAATLFVLGAISIFCNYFADAQRQRVRATGGQCRVWGKKPVIIVGRYEIDGERKESLLLASGFWGIARHFHYVPELLGALFWTLPALFGHALPYFYVLFLTILLTDRAFRDDRRCAEKYGADWDAYCARVPWKIIPGLL